LGLARYVKLNRRLSRSEALYRSFLSASPDGIAITDMEMRFLMVSPKALAMFGFEHEKDIIGLKPFDLVIPEDLERAHGNSKLMLKGGAALGPREYRAIKPDGTFIDFEVNTDFVRNSSGLPTSLVMVIREIGDRKRMQEKLELQATTDGLTGLYNRHYIIEKIQAAFETFRRSGEPFSLVIADIDLFKQVNDAFGHNGGDGVLRFVAEELGKESRLCDTIARWGGEEFLFLLPSTDINLAMRIAERVRCRFEGKPFNWEGKQLSISLTFGVVSVYAQDTPESLIDRADQAMYQGKREGRNRVVNGNEMK
jgi:diguanylate cyclase (GGDEF)-like protein/PAS domain S-box-containing protein